MALLSRHRQRGAAAIEFGLIFILFFAIFYAIVSYSLAMLIMQGLSHAAEEGARAALAVDPLAYAGPAAYTDAVETAAETQAAQALAWLPDKAHQQIVENNKVTATVVGNLLTVTVTYPNYATNGLIPTLTLPGVGAVPRLPTDLVGQASLQIS